jgi:hypothetical protein
MSSWCTADELEISLESIKIFHRPLTFKTVVQNVFTSAMEINKKDSLRHPVTIENDRSKGIFLFCSGPPLLMILSSRAPSTDN